MNFKNIILFGLGYLVLTACATSPTGRKQLLLQSDSSMDAMGIQSFQQVKQQTPIETDPRINAYVRCIALPITEAAKGRTSVDHWEIVVFKDHTANAFALPGGKIGVNTGILPVAKTDAQLAAVLGHEVGHVIAKHGNERVSESEGTQLGLAVADYAAGSMTGMNQKILMAGLGMGAQYGVMLPFSRAQESEADLIGLDLMSNAGFDPNQSVELWKNMMAEGGKAPSEWMSDHPSDQRRMAALSSHLPEYLPVYQTARAAGKAPHCVLSK